MGRSKNDMLRRLFGMLAGMLVGMITLPGMVAGALGRAVWMRLIGGPPAVEEDAADAYEAVADTVEARVEVQECRAERERVPVARPATPARDMRAQREQALSYLQAVIRRHARPSLDGLPAAVVARLEAVRDVRDALPLRDGLLKALGRSGPVARPRPAPPPPREPEDEPAAAFAM